MALIGNYSVLMKNPGRYFAGSSAAQQVAVRSNWNRSGSIRNVQFRNMNTTAYQLWGIPDGYYPPDTWMLPTKNGAMHSLGQIAGAGSLTSSGTMGLNAAAGLTGSGDITSATAQLVISMIANLVGSGDITAADLRGYLQAVANLIGSGDLTGTLGALGWLTAPVTGSGAASATINATGTLAADITVTGATLTTANVGAAVWQYLIESGYSGEEIMRLLAAHAAGDALSLEGATPEFKSIDGTKTRIGGTYVTGTRTVTTRDGS